MSYPDPPPPDPETGAYDRDRPSSGSSLSSDPVTTTSTTTSTGSSVRDQFGGLNLGSAFFGYLVTVAMVVLLGAIVTAIASAVGQQLDFRPSQLTGGDAQTISIVSGVVLLVVLLVGYYTGGYVAGRMSRFDGGRQGFGVWLIGLVLAIVAGVLGVVFGDQYNILDQVDLPRVPIDRDNLGWGALITAAAIVIGSLLAAIAGGKVGRRYHGRVDRAAGYPPAA